jgi:hypothetical protein
VTYSRQDLRIEAVDGGFIIKGHFGGKDSTTVALDGPGLAAIVKSWATQRQPKAT